MPRLLTARRHPNRSSCFAPLALAAATLLLPWSTASAQGATLAVPSAHARVGFERIRLPGDERVGLLGTSYLVDLPVVEGLAAGPAVYGAITGHRGGFFAIGGEAAWRRQLAGPLGIELGLFAGGGGGAGAPAGGGLMLRPHADLLWDFGRFALGLSVSRVQFPSGDIGSTQVGVVFNAINDFRYVPAARIGTPVRPRGRAGLGFDRIQLVGGMVHLRADTLLADGSSAPRDFGTIGIRAEQSFSPNFYWGLEANGAVQSRVAGYAEYLGIVGFETEAVRNTLNLGARVGLGMAGGGGIQTGGGLVGKAALYGVLRLSNEFGLGFEVGVAGARHGDFRAAHASASLVWALDGPDSDNSAARPARTDFSVGVQRHDAARRDGTTRALEASVLKVHRYVSRNFYVAGQVNSAVGGGAGGHLTALVGVGWNQPLGAGFNVGAELLGGAAGGGGVDSRGGVVQPMLYAGYQLTPAVALRLGAGRVKAFDGPLSSSLVDFSVVISYGVSAGS